MYFNDYVKSGGTLTLLFSPYIDSQLREYIWLLGFSVHWIKTNTFLVQSKREQKSIDDRIVLEAHDGTIIARSEGIGHGSTFIIDLPILQA